MKFRNLKISKINIAKYIKIITVLCVLTSQIIFTGSSSAVEIKLKEIKAGFIYKFIFFCDWPDKKFSSDESPIIIGVIDDNYITDILKKVEGQTVGKRKLVIKRFNLNTSAFKLRQCHILYINPFLKPTMKKLLKILQGSPVITVTHINGFLQMGGMINFVKVEDRLTFEINNASARRVGIKIRSRLLRVAIRIIED